MKVEIWSDIVCPWCYIGKRRLEAALEEFEHADQVEITWRSFELDPSAPAELEEDLVGHLAQKYGQPRARAQAMIDQMTKAGADEGIEFRFDQARSGNTFLAHRLLRWASAEGQGGEFKERLMRAYFTEGVLPSDQEALVELAVEVGLNADRALAALADEATAEAVRADERAAREIGVRGVPFFVFDGAMAVSGAQPPEALLEVLERAHHGASDPEPGAGARCDEHGCEVP